MHKSLIVKMIVHNPMPFEHMSKAKQNQDFTMKMNIPNHEDEVILIYKLIFRFFFGNDGFPCQLMCTNLVTMNGLKSS